MQFYAQLATPGIDHTDSESDGRALAATSVAGDRVRSNPNAGDDFPVAPSSWPDFAEHEQTVFRFGMLRE